MTDQVNSVGRAPYVRPELRHYGAITRLVQGSGGSDGDAGGTRTRPKKG